MFVISRNGLGLYHNSDTDLFIEQDSVILMSRKKCLQYLMKHHEKEQAVDIITNMMKNPDTWYSF